MPLLVWDPQKMDLFSLALVILDESRSLIHRYQAFVTLSQRISFNRQNKNVTIYRADKAFWMQLEYPDKTTIYNARKSKLSSTIGVTNVQSDG